MKRKPVKPLITETPAEEQKPSRFFMALYSYSIFTTYTNGQTEEMAGAGHYFITAHTYPSLRVSKELLREELEKNNGKPVHAGNLRMHQFTELSEEDYNNARQ